MAGWWRPGRGSHGQAGLSGGRRVTGWINLAAPTTGRPNITAPTTGRTNITARTTGRINLTERTVGRPNITERVTGRVGAAVGVVDGQDWARVVPGATVGPVTWRYFLATVGPVTWRYFPATVGPVTWRYVPAAVGPVTWRYVLAAVGPVNWRYVPAALAPTTDGWTTGWSAAAAPAATSAARAAAIGPVEDGLAGLEAHAPVASIEAAVMPGAQQRSVVQGEAAAIAVGEVAVGDLAPSGRRITPWPGTATVAHHQRAPQPRRHAAHLPADLDRHRVAVHHDPREARIRQ